MSITNGKIDRINFDDILPKEIEYFYTDSGDAESDINMEDMWCERDDLWGQTCYVVILLKSEEELLIRCKYFIFRKFMEIVINFWFLELSGKPLPDTEIEALYGFSSYVYDKELGFYCDTTPKHLNAKRFFNKSLVETNYSKLIATK